ncbi:MAG: hypothetical protein IT376_06020 [Polyangiaceae bacterium]|nr:hypothetical protein [Polyangiaceae bacterium]
MAERRTRLVERMIVHGGLIEFSTLAAELVTPRTRYLVLDLDRTLHLGRNIGELLGWEIAALRAFGLEELARMEGARTTGRLLFDRSRLAGSMRYLWHGARTWTVPGLYYFFWGKLPARSDWLRAWTYRRFGAEPVRTVQRVPQDTLLALMEHFPEETLRTLVEAVWDRHEPDQVIRREDLDALRRVAPSLEVVITSASPRLVVEVARERLGADYAEGSEPGHINTGPEKIERLAQRFPLALAAGTETVGVTDTGYGEDHCWTEHLTRVADVNSDSPFPPFVSAGSPLQAIHSARLVTNAERRRRAAGTAPWTDTRRPSVIPPERRELDLSQLAAWLGRWGDELEALQSDPITNAWPIARLARDARRALERLALGEAPATSGGPGALGAAGSVAV